MDRRSAGPPNKGMTMTAQQYFMALIERHTGVRMDVGDMVEIHVAASSCNDELFVGGTSAAYGEKARRLYTAAPAELTL